MTANTHSFNVDLAEKIGLNETIILHHLFFWHQKNKANSRNIHDDKVWSYNSVKAFCDIFPYLTRNQITGALKRLQDKGIIEEGNFNKTSFDRTKWYSITGKGLLHFLNSEIDKPENENESSEKKKPIPDSNTDKYTKNNIYKFQFFVTDEVNDTFREYLLLRFKEKLPVTDLVINRLKKKLTEYAKNKEQAVEVIEKAITNKWKDFYALKEDQKLSGGEIKVMSNLQDLSTYKREGK